MATYVLKKGTTSQRAFLSARDATTGLRHDTPGAAAAFVRAGAPGAKRFELVAAGVGEYRPGGLAEVDAELLPGVYELGVPDEALAAGADSVLVVVRFPGVHIEPVEIALVAYDPQDADRLGMAAIGPEGRIAALRGAFPRLAAEELAAHEREARA